MEQAIAERIGALRQLLAEGQAAAAREGLDAWYPALGPEELREYGWQLDELYGSCGVLTADMELAAQAYWRAMEHDCYLRSQLEHCSSYLFCLHYLPGISDEELARQHFLYERLLGDIPRFSHRREEHGSHGRIRLGYLSTNFRHHAAADFFLPLFRDADHDRYELYGYSLGEEDAAADRFRQGADHWCRLDPLALEDGAEKIQRDGIDILVDLSGHSDGGLTLALMAHKPAPVQISAIGWVDTTGMPAMDYFLTDSCCALPSADGCFAEKLLRLERPHLCYQPLEPLPVRHSWQEKEGLVFGSFSNFAKLTDEVLGQWKQLLDRVPGSRLELRDTLALPSRQQSVRNRAKGLGFSPAQLSLCGAETGYLQAYGAVDIALDPWPYPGGATTCEALYMGVPVITLAGTRHGSRLGASLLGALELPELIAESPADYIEKAVRLSEDKGRLRELHEGLRHRLERSRLMDGPGYLRALEKAYAGCWQSWLAGTD